jgi:hypothetical protein
MFVKRVAGDMIAAVRLPHLCLTKPLWIRVNLRHPLRPTSVLPTIASFPETAAPCGAAGGEALRIGV